ncbi:MAG TPA: large conductance mechanosensitive channel protein MscL [Thermoanaerobaculia bacterium]|nr:large conductance mechanosensitive channel protein MscL [Thermoanaerobaculia bacterium]
MGLVKEFKEFAIKGNAIDLAIAVILGAAFGKVITSIVDDLLMPIIGILVGKHDFSDYFITLSPGHYDSVAQAKAAGAATFNYGLFINAVITFLIVAFAIFMIVKQINRMNRKPAQAVTPTMRDCTECLSAIPRDARRCKFCGSVQSAGAPGLA